MTRKRTPHTVKLIVGILALAMVALSACSSSGGSDGASSDSTKPATTAPATDAGVSGDAVSIKGFAFEPPVLKVKVGTTVTWTNDDPASHTATADDDSFDTKSLKTGRTGSFTFDKAGTFKYHCDIHPTMTAEVIVS